MIVKCITCGKTIIDTVLGYKKVKEGQFNILLQTCVHCADKTTKFIQSSNITTR